MIAGLQVAPAQLSVAARPALTRLLEVAFDAGDPRARLPVETGLAAERHAVELGRRCWWPSSAVPRDGIAQNGVGVGLAPAVAGVHAEIGSGPTPRGHDGRLVERECVGRQWRVVYRSQRIEFVVEAGAHDVVGNP